MTHLALLGDSVIDNKAYVGAAPDVAEQVRMIAGRDWTVTRLARDGAVTADVMQQLASVPGNATHLVISAGGNDALQYSGVLDDRAVSVAEVLFRLAEIQGSFRQTYGRMLDRVHAAKRSTAVCTVYEPRFPEPGRRHLAAVALSVINDVITREAFARGFDLIDLRVIFDADLDFANPIEPSERGGKKLARAIQRFVLKDAQTRDISSL